MKNSIMNNFFIGILLSLLLTGNQVFAVQDEFVERTLDTSSLEKPQTFLEYNFQDITTIPVRLSITEKISSETKVYDGQKVEFRVVSDVKHNGKTIIKTGTIVTARIETTISSGMNGIPASIIFSNFQIPNISQGQITDSYELIGQDRSLIVFPLKWALTILPPTGSLTNFIKGGHARLSPNKIIQLYYHPNWI